MEITTYKILERTKRAAISVASISDFRLEPSAVRLDLDQLISDSNILPYCIDLVKGEVVLAELPSNFNIASYSFFYEAQYRNAIQIHTMKIAHFIASAKKLGRPARAILIYSMGRCGSTLLIKALNKIEGITTFSEPDIFSQLAIAGRLEDEQTRRVFIDLYDSFFRFFHRNRSNILAFKFRGIVCEHADCIGASSPNLTSIFLYRHAVDVARSYARLSNRSLSIWILNEGQKQAWSRFAPIIKMLDGPITGYDLMAALWAGPVLRYLETQSEGVWRGALNYSDFLDNPAGAVNFLLDGVALQPSAHCSANVFGSHSQLGSHLSPNRLVLDTELEKELASPEFPQRIYQSLQRIDPRLHPDLVLQGTYAN